MLVIESFSHYACNNSANTLAQPTIENITGLNCTMARIQPGINSRSCRWQ